MAKISAKVMSILMAAILLVSMVPMMVSAEASAPEIELSPEMVVLSNEQEGNTFSYKIAYLHNSFVFKLSYAAGLQAKVTNRPGTVFSADSEGFYSLPTIQETEYTYKINIYEADPEAGVEYTLKIQRMKNNQAEISAILGEGFTATLQDKVWAVETNENMEELVICPVLSDGATMTVVNQMGQAVVAEKDGTIKIYENTTLTATVEDQQKSKKEIWTIKVVMDHGSNACALLGIDDAKDSGNGYVANTSNEKFLVNATVSEGATYKLYSDAECTKEIVNKELTLTEKTTTIYIKVLASNGKDSSISSLTINTTKVAAGTEAPKNELPYGGYPFFELRGGFPMQSEDPEKMVITVPLEKGTTTFKFDARVPLGSELVLYGDENKRTLVKNGTTIKLDGGVTVMKAQVLPRMGEPEEVEIVIEVPMVATYKDQITPWAAPYVNGLNEMGLGLLRGDEKGNFNGQKGLNRYEMAALMIRLSGTNKDFFSGFSTPFTDKIADWAANYVKAAYKMDLIAGIEVEGKLEFQGAKTSTRNQFFRIFMNVTLAKEGTDVDQFYKANKEAIDEFVAKKEFKDAEKVADWAKAGTYSAIYLGYIVGDEKGNINPEKEITRNEAAVVLYKVIGEA
ncbi:MAG: S-layer homology domain-containing protein [Clostridia bacterium]|nr:S-layer homology domain-containing protein [Clostridia bacterium]